MDIRTLQHRGLWGTDGTFKRYAHLVKVDNGFNVGIATTEHDISDAVYVFPGPVSENEALDVYDDSDIIYAKFEHLFKLEL